MLDRVGAGVLAVLAWVGEVSLFGLRALVEAFRPPYEFREIARHMFEIGWRSTPLIATSGFAIGVVLSLHTRASLERFGAEVLIHAGLGVALVRETGPLITALLVAGRVGAVPRSKPKPVAPVLKSIPMGHEGRTCERTNSSVHRRDDRRADWRGCHLPLLYGARTGLARPT
jgi:hypothetical protein